MIQVFTGQIAILFFHRVQARRIHPSQTRQAETLDGTGCLGGIYPEFALFCSLLIAVSPFYILPVVGFICGVALR